MIAISHPKDEMELALQISILESEDIPYFVRGQHFGSLYPGPQIASYNERTIMVPEQFIERSTKLLCEFQEIENDSYQSYSVLSKVRMVIETIIFAWFIPGGKKVISNK